MTPPGSGAVGAPSSPASRKPAAAVWWQARTAREQKLLGVGAVVLLAFATWQLAMAPALHTITAAHQRLPVLRADAALAGAIALDAQALRSHAPMVFDANVTLDEQLRDWLRRSGLDSTMRVVLQSPDGGARQVQLIVDNAESAGLMRWLAMLPEILPVTIVDAALARTVIDGRDQPGRISGTVALRALPEGNSP